MNEDNELLRRFADEGSQEAFRALVERKVGLVFAAALRQMGGEAHLAQDVTQAVFIALAANAARLKRHAVLAGWLHTTTRHLAIGTLRRQRRWQRREAEANAMNVENRTGNAPWEQVRPEIDAALQELAARDRDAILLRFFEGRAFGEVGAAVGLAENAARMRVERALEKLRGALARRGITSTAAALGGALAAQPAVAVPAGLAASAAGAGLASAAASGAVMALPTLGVANFMTTKFAWSACGVLAALGLGGWFGATYQQRGDAARSEAFASHGTVAVLRAENARLQQDLARARAQASGEKSTDAAPGGRAADAREAERGYRALRTLIDVRRRRLGSVEFEFFGDEAKVEPAFVELFEISEAEHAALQAAIDRARGRLNALVRENSSVSRTPNGEVAIAIKPFPEAGGAVYDAMLKTFADTLGGERYAAFLALGAEQAEKRLGRFGVAERTILLSRDASGGEPRYRINDHSRWSDRDNSNYHSDHMTAERLAREMGPLVDVLPADFLARR